MTKGAGRGGRCESEEKSMRVVSASEGSHGLMEMNEIQRTDTNDGGGSSGGGSDRFSVR